MLNANNKKIKEVGGGELTGHPVRRVIANSHNYIFSSIQTIETFGVAPEKCEWQ